MLAARRLWAAIVGKPVMADKVVTYESLVRLLAGGEVTLVDVRSPDEVSRGKIAPDALNIPVSELERALSLPPEEFKAKYGIAKPELADPTLVFHCGVGIRSQKALHTAHRLGFSGARHFPGGYNEWISKQSK